MCCSSKLPVLVYKPEVASQRSASLNLPAYNTKISDGYVEIIHDFLTEENVF